MTEILRFWRDKPLSEKQEIMKSKNIKVMTYSQIKTIYNESKLQK